MQDQEHLFELPVPFEDTDEQTTDDDRGGQPIMPRLDRFPDNSVPRQVFDAVILVARGNYCVNGHKEVARDPELLSNYLHTELERRGLPGLLAPDSYTQILEHLRDSVQQMQDSCNRAGLDGIRRKINGYEFLVAYAQILYIF